MSRPFRLGVVVNPVAGIGGPAALKGSDGDAARIAAHAAYRSQSTGRMARALATVTQSCEVYTLLGAMGADACDEAGLPAHVHAGAAARATTSADTRAGVRVLQGICDLILFAGGDGTARDVLDALDTDCPVLGVPAGVKMHSGVFARTPEATADLVARILRGEMVGATRAEVRDIDEAKLRDGEVNSRFYGELLVAGDLTWLQATKVGGRESVPLAHVEIAAWIMERLEPSLTYFIGAGTTTGAIKAALGDPSTLLRVYVWKGAAWLAKDADEKTLAEIADDHTRIVLGVTGGQGFLLGRGNQQFSPRVIRAVGGPAHITIVATRTKLAGLGGRALGVDTGDPELDAELAGLWPIVTGYEEEVLYRVG